MAGQLNVPKTELITRVSATELCMDEQSSEGGISAAGTSIFSGGNQRAKGQAEPKRKVALVGQGQRDKSPIETTPLRILISDRSALGCELMLHSLSRRRGLIDSVLCATSSADVEHVARTQEPEVALISAALRDGPLAGFRVLPSLQTILPKCPVIVLLDDCDEELVVDAFRAKARGVFYRADPVEQLVRCIEAVHQGQIWVRPKELRAVLDAFAESSPFTGPVNTNLRLNDREMMVARLVATGQTNRQIARRLNLSEHTVKNYLYRLFEKIGIQSRVELAVMMMNEPLQNGTNG